MSYRWILFVGIVQSILFLGHWFLYRTLLRFLGPMNPSALMLLRLGAALLSISFVAASLLAFSYSNLFTRCLYTGAASWLGIVYLLILASAISWMFLGMSKLFGYYPSSRIVVGFFGGVALIACVYGFINAETIRMTRIRLALPGLPVEWKGKTAVWVSDTHLGQVRSESFSRKVAGMIRGLHPDILFVGGDLYDGAAVDLDKVIEAFSKVSPPYGTFFVTGNHEEFSDNTRYLRAVRRAGMRVLYNEKIEIAGLQIVGVDYRDTREENRFKTILEKLRIDRGKPSILLMHAPFHVQAAHEAGISLQLSGHTHRGQVLLFRWITSWVYHGYDYGLKRYGDLLIYTSSGAGTWGPPMRIDTIPEIVVIEFG